ncbi:putative anti-sigma regulatory factor, serine/threonine protein kinase [Solidesulfovibrio carbinoliphilus subsp. oakridgensis]|uniref:Anti-sigma regulatory factor, serine/threonine protein kinase n=1 Tax=Solidesulfovibrio carbinoliphilus subsp. oakridgensis TaxID=694327 RepID=G7Q6I7_9BACT|nr:anti-sigma regulatory factor [Solidesulfovibrio carbinoliphilus]EHJ47600.1 putative anti-sigma regulatory factor, serine/threonine protein kinase [Solidesulfovibrio carbinoliphilus subsp. oakridgensis]
MRTIESESFPVVDEAGIVGARQRARGHATKVGLGLVSQTKLVTVVSELARNMVDYGGGGLVTIEQLDNHGRAGVRVRFEDQGPGIEDLELAMQDGYTTGKGLGQGLPGSKRLVNEFTIESQPGQGTRIMVIQWT